MPFAPTVPSTPFTASTPLYTPLHPLKNRQKPIHTVEQRYKLGIRYRFFKFFGGIVRSGGHVGAYLRADLDR